MGGLADGQDIGALRGVGPLEHMGVYYMVMLPL